jgi:hypothetical protein
MAKSGGKGLSDLSSVNFGTILRDALKFSVRPKRFLPFLISDAIAVSFILIILGNNLAAISVALYTNEFPEQLIYPMALGVLLAVLWSLVNIWITGSVIHQSWKNAEFRKSWGIALRRFPSMFMALLVVGIISFSFSMIPYIGSILSMIVSIAFLFTNQFVMVGGKGFWGAIVGSGKTFRRKPLAVFVSWLIPGVISIMLLLLFMLPLLSLVAAFTYADMQTEALELLIDGGGMWLYFCIVVALIGVSISRTFALNFLTGAYISLNKKKWIFF